jgi:hypothetical protein
METVDVKIHDDGGEDGENCWVPQLHAALGCEADHDRAEKFLRETIEMSLNQMREIVQTTINFMKDGQTDERLFIDLIGAMTHPEETEGDDQHIAAGMFAAIVISTARKSLNLESGN